MCVSVCVSVHGYALYVTLYIYVCTYVCIFYSSIIFVCAAPEKDRASSELEVKVWEPNQMSDYKVEQFLVVARYEKFTMIIRLIYFTGTDQLVHLLERC